VVDPALDLSGAIAPETVAAAISAAVRARDLPADGAVAVVLRWEGLPSYGRLAELARGLAAAEAGGPRAPLIAIIDRDLAASVGAILAEEHAPGRGLVCLDNIELSPFDFVDIGPPVWPAGVFPVVIKSLLFGSATAVRPAGRPDSQAGRSA
jgi:ethanolamine utilization protein EutA